MLTGASETVDRIIGLEVGADDYIAKPFDPRELRRAASAACCAACSAAAGAAESPRSRGCAIGRCRLDLAAHAACSTATARRSR